MMRYKFTFDTGVVYVDGRQASQAELMDILVYQQKRIDGLEDELERLYRLSTREEGYSEDLYRKISSFAGSGK